MPETIAERLLAEEELIGFILSHPDHLPRVRQSLRACHFQDAALRSVYEMLPHLGATFDLGSVARFLQDHKIDPPNGSGWGTILSECIDKGASACAASPESNFKTLRNRWIRRRRRELLIGAAQDVDSKDPSEAARTLVRDLVELEREESLAAGQTDLRIMPAEDLLGTIFPPREYVLNPIIQCRDLFEVYAARGVGKSWYAMQLAVAIASGGACFRYEAPVSRVVLLVDGELPRETLQDRVRICSEAHDLSPGQNLRVLAADFQEPGRMPDFGTAAGQAELEGRHLSGVEVVIFDNVSTLFATQDENAAGEWQTAQDFLLRLRRRGLTAGIVHHAGLSGRARGTTKREDVLDTVIRLKHPDDYSPTEGARFEVSYTKARGAYGQELAPFEVRLEVDPLTRLPVWTMRSLEDATYNRVIELAREGLTGTDIAKEVGRHKSRVSRMLDRARKEGRIE